MKPIKFGFSRAKPWWLLGSTAIMWAEKRPYSHVYVQIENTIYQASHGAVNKVPKEWFDSKNFTSRLYEKDCPLSTYISATLKCESSLGIPYSRLQIVLIAVKKLFHLSTGEVNKDSAMICSEFAARIALVLGIELPKNLDYLTPSDFEKILEASKMVNRVL